MKIMRYAWNDDIENNIIYRNLIEWNIADIFSNLVNNANHI